ncbi:MAG: hypothetical protein K2I89_07150 [Muribaculaceae bacterium]|nr:hypothetical protein [Muribaculaceae bacterium]
MKAICDFGERMRHFADSSAHRNRYPFFIPDTSVEWCAKICPAIKISRLGTHIARKFASRYYDSVAPAVIFMSSAAADDFANADERYFVCDSAYCLGDSVAIGGQETEHIISIGDKHLNFTTQTLNADEIVSKLSEFATLKMGDLVIFGNNGFNISINVGEQLTVKLDGADSIDIKIK